MQQYSKFPCSKRLFGINTLDFGLPRKYASRMNSSRRLQLRQSATEFKHGRMTRSFFRDSFFSMIGGVSASVADLVSGIIMARALGASGIGTVAFAVWASTVIYRLLSVGLPSTLSRYLPELRSASEHAQADGLAGYILRRCGLVSVGVLALALAIYTIFGLRILEDPIEDGGLAHAPWVAILVIAGVQAIALPFNEYLSGMQRFRELGLLLFLSSVIRTIAIAIGVLLAGVTGAIASYVVAGLIPAALALGLMLRKPSIEDGLKLRVMRYARYSWASNLIETFVWFRTEIFFIAYYLGSVEVGHFTVGYSIANAAVLLPTLMTAPLLPYFSEQIGAKAIEKLQFAYASATRLVALIVIPACFGMAAICPVVILAVYGQEFTQAVVPAMIIIAVAAIGPVINPTAQLIYSMERGHLFVISNLIGSGVLVSACILLIPAYGLIGAAWAKVIANVLVSAIEVGYVAKKTGFAIPVEAVARIILAAASSAAVAYICIRTMNPLLSLPIGVPLSVFTYVFLVRFLRVLKASDKELLITAAQQAPKCLRSPTERVAHYLTGNIG
jgi:O-antigen/teichoic acid export membrane protein